MRKSIMAAALALTTMAGPVLAAPLCINSRDITSSESKDGKVLTFHMRDGTVLRNHLVTPCTGLIFNGFVWTLRGSDQICENAQTLRVLHTEEVCSLGNFEKP